MSASITSPRRLRRTHVAGLGYCSSIDGTGWPDYVTLDNGGSALDGTYRTRDYVAVTRCRECARSEGCPLGEHSGDGFCAWGRPEGMGTDPKGES